MIVDMHSRIPAKSVLRVSIATFRDGGRGSTKNKNSYNKPLQRSARRLRVLGRSTVGRMVVVKNEEMFEACAAARAPGLTFEIYAQVWDAVCRWVHHAVDECGHGVNIPHFLKITWAGSQYKDSGGYASAASSPSKKAGSAGPQGYVRRPHVILHVRVSLVSLKRAHARPSRRCKRSTGSLTLRRSGWFRRVLSGSMTSSSGVRRSCPRPSARISTASRLHSSTAKQTGGRS